MFIIFIFETQIFLDKTNFIFVIEQAKNSPLPLTFLVLN